MSHHVEHTSPDHDRAQAEKPDLEEQARRLEAARIQHDRDLEEQAKSLEKTLQEVKHTHELEEKVKHLQQEVEDARHPAAPLPWPLNHLHGQAEGDGNTEVAVMIAHPGDEVSGHVVESAQVDHGEHAVEAVAEPVHHEVVVEHEVVG